MPNNKYATSNGQPGPFRYDHRFHHVFLGFSSGSLVERGSGSCSAAFVPPFCGGGCN